MDNPLDHRGRVVLVTGGTKGIGRTIARRYAEAGATVAVCARTAPDDTAAGVDFVACDVREADQVTALVDTIVDRHGRLDVVVNNAGITRDQLLVRMKDEDWDQVMDTNLRGVFLLTRAAAKAMMRQRSGRIINVSSTAGAMGNPGDFEDLMKGLRHHRM